MKIKALSAREILDSRGFPTIECNLTLNNNLMVTASVPAGASIGTHEALELRDHDQNRFDGKGVLKAIANIEKKIAPLLLGKEPDLIAIDKLMIDLDGTGNKANLGANATLAVSIAVARAQAAMNNIQEYELIQQLFKVKQLTLPRCMFNILNGGMHADNDLIFQEFMVMPRKHMSIKETLPIIFQVYQQLKTLLHEDGYLTSVGDEGGFAPHLKAKGLEKERLALDYVMRAIERSGFQNDVGICLDIAASYFYDAKQGIYNVEGVTLERDELVAFYSKLITSYPICSIEDGMAQDDMQGWQLLTQELGDKIMLVGDDIFVTSPERIQNGMKNKIANAVLIKPNQRGTISETYAALQTSKNGVYITVVSHRSGETNDTFIADFAVGTAADFFKAGACARGERVAKYDRLLAIEEQL